MRAVALTATLACLPPLLAGCGQDLAFRTDHRVEITGPGDRSTVTLPLHLAWRVSEPRAVASLVLVDRAAVHPGAPVTDLGEDLTGVTRVTGTSLELTALPDRTDVSDADKVRHEITVLLVDERGRRIGEAGDTVTVTVRR